MTQLLSAHSLTFSNVKPAWFSRQKRREFQLGPLDLSIEKAETVAIIGGNRSGKSLLAKLLCGAIEPSAGEIQFHQETTGHSKADLLRWQKRQVRMIFQRSSESLNPALIIGDILQEPLKLNTDQTAAEREERVEQVLVQVGLLRDHFFFYPHMLSDGQQQRVAMARALILNPSIIVADEPFAALDPSVRSQTVNLVLRLQRELGLSFVFISHNLGIVRHIADRIIVMHDGQIVETGRTDTLFRWPKHDVTKRLVSAHQSLVRQHQTHA
ncbi:ATP-binding cassette domain-containing protein [Alteromonas oceanisediminis]|uniref:ATP-binding cassette domain-containing protein n=1 Tax=Alteromonas oceanisediminis TaxID=2836180 RepID=UPI001BDA6AB8|nr:ATP-binding cassette domain-containing protein [Alteromonas oceanisediminis]MBT0584879.1 ATP-binding cassette domain-containing protein [Alteromonas oceanisediminis]